MKRVFPSSFVVLLVLSVGCQKPASPAAGTTPPAGTPAGTPAAAAPSAPGSPAAASGPGAPGAPTPAATVKPVPATLPDVVAKVGSESIERWELESALKQAEANAGSSVPADRRDAVLRSILDELVTYHLLDQEGRARKMTVTDAELDAQLKMIHAGFPTEEAFQQALATRGLTTEHLKQQERRNLMSKKLVDQEVNSKLSVQDTEVDAFYMQNVERFKEGETVHASHILIAVPDAANAAQKEQAKAKAQQILKEVRSGGDFAALAKQHSQDESASKGGDLGFIGKGEAPPTFDTVAFALKPGTVSDVIETPQGFHIVKVIERRGPRTAPLTEVRAQLKEFMLRQQQQDKLEQFITATKAKTKVDILV